MIDQGRRALGTNGVFTRERCTMRADPDNDVAIMEIRKQADIMANKIKLMFDSVLKRQLRSDLAVMQAHLDQWKSQCGLVRRLFILARTRAFRDLFEPT